MVFFNYALRKLNAKIVYYGPGLCGKTTNLQWIHDHFEGGQRGKMISLSTEGDRTIFFDLLPLDIGTIRAMQVTLQLYTVPGQVHYNSTRQLVLRGADGVVFVADSQRTMRSSNVDSLRNLQENLMLQGVDLKGFPHVLQFNKRDLRDLLTIDDMDRELNFYSVPFFEAVATEGVGVQETLEGIVKLVMRSLRERYEPVAPPTQRAGATTIAPPVPLRSQPAATPVRPAPSPPARPAARPPVAPGAAKAPPPPSPPPFEVSADQDHVSTGVYSEARRRHVAGQGVNLTTASLEGPPDRFEGAISPPPDVPQSLPDEPTRVREGRLPSEEPVIVRAPEVDPWRSPRPRPDPSKPFSDQDTATSFAPPPIDEFEAALPREADFEFGVAVDAPADEPLEPVGPAPGDTEIVFRPETMEAEIADEVPSEAGDWEPAAGDVTDATAPVWEDVEEAEVAEEAAAAASAEPDVKPVEEPPPAPPLGPPPRRAARPGSVDDLVASILGSRPAPRRPPSYTVEQPPGPAAEPPVEPARPAERPPHPAAKPADRPARPGPVTVGGGDPFVLVEPEAPPARPMPAPLAKPTGAPGGIVRVGDNQLHLRLQGTGAIAESGQVRALDIEVPVPGSWVGNRRVTLQLRLTLSPAEEDDDGESGGAS